MRENREIKASILVPVYKAEKYIRRCLDSLVHQTCQESYEILCIDDGSPDQSGKILDEYAEKYPFVRIYHQENRGVAKTREIAVGKARGRYIFWVDADDYADERLLETALPLLETSGADILVYSFREVNAGENFSDIVIKERSLENWRRDTINAKQSVIWNIAIKRSLWPEEPAPEELSCAGEDGYMALQIFGKAEKVISASDILVYHTVDNQSSVSHTFTGKMYLGNAHLWYLRYHIAREHFPDLVSFCAARAFSGLVKAYCMQLYYRDLSEKEVKEIRHRLEELQKKQIPGRYRDKLLAFCIAHGWDSLCLKYARRKQGKKKRKK